MASKSDLQGAKADLNKRVDDVQKWIWHTIIPLMLAIIALVGTIFVKLWESRPGLP